jgi:hypothetical protein
MRSTVAATSPAAAPIITAVLWSETKLTMSAMVAFP